MKSILNLFCMAFFLLVVDFFSGCIKVVSISQRPNTLKTCCEQADDKLYQRSQTIIPLFLPKGMGQVNADVYRPQNPLLPKTLIIMVPGAGTVSRRGEVSQNGISHYEQPINVTENWAKALASNGYFVVSYDKRTCSSSTNPLCFNNDQQDIQEEGIRALSRDLDQIFSFLSRKLRLDEGDRRIVLMSQSQGAQVIGLSESKNDAAGIILLSPIINDLSKMWTDGLLRASADEENFNKKNKLLNQKESMASFFDSLKAGRFSKGAFIHGASAKFWSTWLDESGQTLNHLRAISTPSLLLFAKEDVFCPCLNDEEDSELSHRSSAQTAFVDCTDRNLVVLPHGVCNEALKHAVIFMHNLSPPDSILAK